ncbi:MAG: hypothetical protein IPH93_12635 [Saprospiraceae bacterium]|nr:hypothetical protein [Saprospiraceae bacterium]
MHRLFFNWFSKIIIIVCFIACYNLSGQNHSIRTEIELQLKNEGKPKIFSPFSPITITSLDKTISQKIQNNIKQFSLLHLNQEVLQKIYTDQSSLIRIQLLAPEQELNLILKEHVLFSNQSKILTSEDAIGTKPQRARHFRGVVEGIEGSLVAISVFSNEIMGVVSIPNLGNLNLGKLSSTTETENNEDVYISYFEKDLNAQSNFQCGVEEDFSISDLAQSVNSQQTIFDTRCRTVRVFLECDYKMYQDRNLQKNQVVNYVTGLFNVVKTLYSNERVNLEISDIMVWTTPDPFPKTTLQNILLSYANYRKNDFTGDLAQLVSTATAQQQGGIAFVNGMCTNWNGQLGPLSYAWINNSFQPLPIYSWSVEVMAHELGHNFGSWHTHSCVWGPGKNSQLDNCQPPDVGSCAAGPAPFSGGTIMSYCHLTSYGINFSLGFGKEPGDVLRNAINTKSCLMNSYVASQDVNVQGPYFEGDILKLQAKPVNANYSYDWYHYDYKMPGKNDTFLDINYPGIYTAAVSDNCTELADADTLEIEEFKLNLGCPVKPGKVDSVFREINMLVDNVQAKDSIDFPAGLFTSIPASALDVLVEIQHSITAKGTSWARSVLTSYVSPVPVGINKSFYKPAENTAFGEKNTVWFSRKLGRFDPAGKWVFIALDDRTDLNIDADLNIKLVIKWRMPDTITSCEIPLCKGSPLTLTANIPAAQYRWSHGPNTRAAQITTPGTYTLTVTKNNKTTQHTVSVKEYETSFSQSFTLCYGENIRVGNNNYSQSGVYIDTLKASIGCDSIITTEINILPLVESSQEIKLCFGEKINGIPYIKDTELKFVFKLQNGCDSFHRVFVKVSPEVFSRLEVYPACEDIGAKAEVQPSGGIGNIEVLWHTGSKELNIDKISSGLYSIELKDESGCIYTENFEVDNFDSLHVKSTVTDVLCFGDMTGSIALEIESGTAPFFYYWSNGQTESELKNISAGSYILYLRDLNNCLEELHFDVKSPDLMIASINTKSSTAQDGEANAEVSNGIQPYKYQWSNKESVEKIVGLTPGDYSVTITDANDCERILNFTIGTAVSVYNTLKDQGIIIQPNPFNDILEIECKFGEFRSVSLMDLLGKNICKIPISQGGSKIIIQTDFLNSAYYILEIAMKDGRLIRILVLKL